jgi:DNA-binding MarR family transcriptional regulator
VRRAHNAVFVNLPADGLRLTDLADEAGISKQAMGELVDDLETKGYVERLPDPTDGRAKLIMWADRGRRAHEETLRVFEAIESEIALAAGADAVAALRSALLAIRAGLDPD